MGLTYYRYWGTPTRPTSKVCKTILHNSSAGTYACVCHLLAPYIDNNQIWVRLGWTHVLELTIRLDRLNYHVLFLCTCSHASHIKKVFWGFKFWVRLWQNAQRAFGRNLFPKNFLHFMHHIFIFWSCIVFWMGCMVFWFSVIWLALIWMTLIGTTLKCHRTLGPMWFQVCPMWFQVCPMLFWVWIMILRELIKN